VSAEQRGGSRTPDSPDPTTPANPADYWGADELDLLLAHPGDGPVAQILAAAGAPSEAAHQPGEDAAIAAFRSAFSVSRSGKPRIFSTRMSHRGAAAVLAGGLVLSVSAAAAAGVLPGPVQQTAKALLANVGLTVPGPKDHTTGPGASTPVPVTSAEPTAGAPGAGSSGQGSDVSGLAHSTTATGVDKGAAVSSAASNGRSHAGRHGKAGTTPTPHASQPPTSHKPTTPPKHTPTPHPTRTSTPQPTHTPTPQRSHPLTPQPTHDPPAKAGA
jgi:hypothetical protein